MYINGRFLTQPTTGVQRFASELLLALDQVIGSDPSFTTNNKIICLIPNDMEDVNLPEWKNIAIQKCGRFTGNLWEQITLPFYARKGLLVDLCNIGPVLHFNQIVVFHDASVFAVPEAYSLAFKAKYRFVMSILAHRAKQIVTDSTFSKNELSRYLKVSKDKIIIIFGGCDHILNIKQNDSILTENHLSSIPFLLTVGSSSKHKNTIKLVEAIEQNPDKSLRLVIAGGNFSKVFRSVNWINSPKILHLGYVTDGELRSLYSQAIGFVFPSLYEGFGFPPLEAMACGCPVISSNKASLPEICGDAASFFNPLNIDEINLQINRLINDNSLRDSLKQKGSQRAKQFTWNDSARQYLLIIKEYLQS